eukprot:CFRG3059T1
MGQQNSHQVVEHQSHRQVRQGSFAVDGVVEVGQKDDDYYGDAATQILRDLPALNAFTSKQSHKPTTSAYRNNQRLDNPKDSPILKPINASSLYRIMARLDMERLAETRSIVTTQTAIKDAMRTIDSKAGKSHDVVFVTLRSLDRSRTYISEIQGVGKLLSTVRASVVDMSTCLTRLNLLLPENDRLEPFVWSVLPEHVDSKQVHDHRAYAEARVKEIQSKLYKERDGINTTRHDRQSTSAKLRNESTPPAINAAII